MQKIKREVYDRLIVEDLTRLELKFLFYLYRCCNSKGEVAGLYYAEISKHLNFSEAMFYNLRDSLTNKKFISWEKNNSADIDIKLIANDFTVIKNSTVEVEYRDYIDINIEIFNNPKFFDIKAKAIQLVLHVIKCVASKEAITYANMKSAVNSYKAQAKRTLWFNDSNEYKCLAKLLNVKIRALKGYFDEIIEWIEIKKENDTVEDKKYRNKRIITVIKTALLKPTYLANKNSKMNMHNVYPERYAYLHYIKTLCRRNKIFADPNNKSDVADLIYQYIKLFKDAGKDILMYIEKFILKAGTNELNSYYIHSCLKNELSF